MSLITEITSITAARHCVISRGSFEFSTLNANQPKKHPKQVFFFRKIHPTYDLKDEHTCYPGLIVRYDNSMLMPFCERDDLSTRQMG
ncbi:hypothetical protein GQ43DRAFT_298129 [Delitschia confertaspora ATCC 74209]|uniref:Uncharacterized protein n=1 Tax=Delitschia confertaspora ATCC 74209 TaxID=1513339 RepID=A0A9P4JNN7_9PLEO|nr:hypothetical protein GQ43DRAFT_298129 [Delitschia confertaspora ATCC 74209]